MSGCTDQAIDRAVSAVRAANSETVAPPQARLRAPYTATAQHAPVPSTTTTTSDQVSPAFTTVSNPPVVMNASTTSAPARTSPITASVPCRGWRGAVSGAAGPNSCAAPCGAGATDVTGAEASSARRRVDAVGSASKRIRVGLHGQFSAALPGALALDGGAGLTAHRGQAVGVA